jgi:hypothetical protein
MHTPDAQVATVKLVADGSADVKTQLAEELQRLC